MAHLLYNSAFENYKNQFEEYFKPMGKGLQGLLVDSAMQKTPNTIKAIVPTGRRVRFIQRAITTAVWKAFSTPTEEQHISTLESFVLDVYSKLSLPTKKRVISDAYKLALFQEAVENCVERKELEFYSRDGSNVSTAIIERLADVIYGVKKKGITPELLEQDIAKSSTTDDEEINIHTLHDIVCVYKEYQHLLGEQLADKATITQDVCAALSGKDIHDILLADTVICIDGFTEFTYPECELLAELAHSSVPVVLALEYSVTNGPLFGNLQEVHERLVTSGYKDCDLDAVAISAEASGVIFTPHTSYIRRWLFNTEKEIRNNSFEKNIHILDAQNRVDEVQTIAKYIRYQILHQGVKPAEICIATRQPENYTQLFREVCAMYDIPVNISDRFPLAKSPVVVALFAALNIITHGYRREDLHRALENPYCTFTTNNGTAIDGDTLYNVAVRLRINGGERRRGVVGWINRLENAAQISSRRLEVLKQDLFAEQVEIDSTERQVEEVQEVLQGIKHLQKLLPEKQQKFTVVDFVDCIKSTFIQGLGIQQTIRDFYKHITDTEHYKNDTVRMLETLEQDTRALGELLTLLDEIAFVYSERFGNARRTFGEFVEILEATVRGAKYQIKEKTNYGVTVTSIEQTRGIPYKVMVVCGLVDREFPVAYTPETFLGKELPDSEMRHIRAERMQFYMALANNTSALENGTAQILLTIPKYATGDEEFIPSPFVEKLEKISTIASTRISTHHAREQVRYNANSTLWCKDWIDSVSSYDEAMMEFMAKPKSELLQQYFNQQPEHRSITDILDIATTYSHHNQTEVAIRYVLEHTLQQELSNLVNKPISASDLEEYASCPYKYFSDKLIRLDEEQTSTNMLSPLERGTLLHAIVYRFYQTIATELVNDGMAEYLPTKGTAPQPVLVRLNPTEYQYYYETLTRLAHEECNRITYEHPFFELEKETLFGTSTTQGTRKGVLENWLRHELQRIEDGWDFVPVLFEFGFGMKAKQTSAQQAIKVGEIYTRGKVDRVEVKQHPDGSHEFIIADYKTTKPGASLTNITRGEKFQIPLYMAAMQQVWQHDYDFTAMIGGGVYYMFMPPNGKYHQQLLVPNNSSVAAIGVSTRSQSKIPTQEQVHDIMQQSLQQAGNTVQAIAHGTFSILPQKNTTCTYCSYSSVCRIKELQAHQQQAEFPDEELGNPLLP